MKTTVTTNKEAIAEFGKPFCLKVYEEFFFDKDLNGICMKINADSKREWMPILREGNRVMINSEEDLKQCISAGEEIAIDIAMNDSIINRFVGGTTSSFHNDYEATIKALNKFEKEFHGLLTTNERVDVTSIKVDIFNLSLVSAVETLANLIKERTNGLYGFEKLLIAHDWSFEMSEDQSVWKRGRDSRTAINSYIKEMPSEWLEEARALYQKYHDKYAPKV